MNEDNDRSARTSSENGNGTSETVPLDNKDDDTLMEEADEYHSKQAYVKASNCLKRIQDSTKLSEQHKRTIQLADRIEELLNEALIPVSDATHNEMNGWSQQTEVHDEFDTSIHYKVDPTTYQLTSRIESIIDSNLLVPLCAVMNESDLHSTWMPKWTFPFTVGVQESIKLGEYNLGHQIVQVRVKLPYPLMSNRQLIINAIACDCIDELNNCIVIRFDTLDTGVHHEITIPEPPRGYKRVDMNGGFVIRACPNDHPLLVHRKQKIAEEQARKKKQGSDLTTEELNTSGAEEEPTMLLVTQIMDVESHVTALPKRLINFFTRTALSKLWHSFLHVAVEVRDGIRRDIQQCVDAKSDFYDWVRSRTSVMIANLQK